MKKIIFLLVLFPAIVWAQSHPDTIISMVNTIIRMVTNPTDVGFGKSSDCDHNNLSFVVNGPLVGRDGLPVGGYIDNGTQRKDWVDPRNYDGNFSIENGFFGVDKNGHPFLVRDEKDIPKDVLWAFQNGPILVENSININNNSESKHRRSGIGFNKKGEIFIIVSLEPITLKKFSELFTNIGCTNAIYLDGGPYVGFSAEGLSYGFVKNAVKLQFFHQK